jgi:integrase
MRGHIRKRGSSYAIVVDIGRDENGRRKQKWISGFKTKKDAEKMLAEVISQIEKGQFIEEKDITVEEYLKYWLDSYAKTNTAPRTYIRYTELANHIIRHLGGFMVQKLKPLHIQQFYSSLLKERKLSNSTILKIHRMFHLALKHAVQWQLINHNPLDAVTSPKPEKIEMKTWDVETANKFLETIKDDIIYIPVLLALQTGMRQGEIAALKWDDVDLEDGYIAVRNTLQKINGKFILKEPKSKKSIRTIALMEITITELKKHRRKQAEMILAMGEKYKNENFVCTWEDGRPLDPSYISKKFFKLVKKYNFPYIRFHDLRHTHATMLLQEGVHPKIVSERLGHSTINITLDVYSHVLPNIQKEAVKKLDKLFKS